MQTSSKKDIMFVGLFTMAFLLGGFIHVVIDPWDLTSCITQIYYSSLVLIWAVTINYRIVNKRVRQLIFSTAALFLLSFFLQMCKYRVFESFDTACRYFWYGYYIPLMLVPVLFLFVCLHLHLQEGERPNRLWLLMLIPSLILILIVMTNDLHELVFVFQDEKTRGNTGTYSYGALYYAIYAWVIAVLALALYISIRKCHIPGIRKKLWMPLYFTSCSIIMILNIFGMPRVNGVVVWMFNECFAMIIIGMEEACIQLGLIPANSNYRMIARLANKPFIIKDESGIAVYSSDNAKEVFQRQENIQIHTEPIKGGSVSWAVDLSDRMRLNREIEKATESIESRNEYLQTENSLKEEQSRLNAKNALYNQIAEIVMPQLYSIERLLEDVEDNRNLAKIAFLNAYIKRRSNMELLKADLKHFPTEELASAIRESCEYLKLCGVNAMLNRVPECDLAADTQLFLYEAYEIVAEECLDTMKYLLVNVTMRKDMPVLRMALKVSDINMNLLQNQIASIGGVISCSSDDEDLEGEVVITIRMQEGGVDL